VKPFAYERAADAESAVAAVLARPDARFLGGGTNLTDHMKLGVADPGLLVDVSRLPFTDVEEQPDGGVLVGGAVRNSDLAAAPLIRTRYPVVAQALLAGASGQLRNLATTAGNLLQRTRCVYFQDVTTACNKRTPGTGCSALGGYTRYHAILGASEHCIATHPSDLAVALAAVEAVLHVTGPDGPREIPFGELHRLPGREPDRDTNLVHGDLITHVALPPQETGTVSLYRKVRDRASYAFALVSVAVVATRDDDGTLSNLRIAYGGLAHKPWRATAAEAVLREAGTAPNDELIGAAADAELAGAQVQGENAFKLRLARNVLVAAVRDLAAGPRAGR
jgi:xanthine dehydrogenase YagS FAD-binding subunit